MTEMKCCSMMCFWWTKKRSYKLKLIKLECWIKILFWKLRKNHKILKLKNYYLKEKRTQDHNKKRMKSLSKKVEKIDDSMLRELILINSYDMKETEYGSKVKSHLVKTQSLRDLEMVVGVNLHLEKSSKETHLLIKLAVCREENLK